MHFIVKVFPEIIIKSNPVRKRFIKQLRDNVRRQVAPLEAAIQVQRDWEKLEVLAPDADDKITRQVADILSRTPGIASFSLVQAYPLGDMDDIFAKTLSHWEARLTDKTFCVRVKRGGKHSFSSIEVERYVGGGLLKHTRAAGVDLHNPDVTVRLEIRGDTLFVVSEQTRGLGGYPLGTQDAALSLISGGFDSTVSTYLTMKRGVRTHFVFFNLGGRAHEMAVKEIAYYLWQKYGSSHGVKFITVPFEGVVGEILERVDNAYMGVILKRMMLRAAAQVAEEYQVPALVTGESIAQVSSQTLRNLSIIDEVTDSLVLRPLVTMDKSDIIDVSRRIGTETFAANVPEYCGVISVRPTTSARRHMVEREEAKFDFSVLEGAIKDKTSTNIQDLVYAMGTDVRAPVESEVPANAVVIDIRHPDEEALKPLQLSGVAVEKIPFYRLNSQFETLDANKHYLLYCEKGVMSQLHAEHLRDANHTNVGVYRPS